MPVAKYFPGEMCSLFPRAFVQLQPPDLFISLFARLEEHEPWSKYLPSVTDNPLTFSWHA